MPYAFPFWFKWYHVSTEVWNEKHGAMMNRQSEASMKDLIHKLIVQIGEDPSRDGLKKTPERVAEMLRFLTSGYRMELNEVVNGAVFEEKFDEMVAVKHIHFYSLCEHHLLPFFGVCHVGYIPDGRLLGLSKIARIVDMFAKRLQLQERMTTQIAEAINEVLKPKGVGVVTEAYHLCMIMRGVEKQESKAVASAMLGGFRENQRTRAEFLSLISSAGLP
jgi:GTP cyclohydrolase I